MQSPTALFKILSDDTRLKILLLLYKEPLCVCELVGILDVPQPRISKNLAKLRDLQLVTDERQEKFVVYALTTDEPLLNIILEDILQNLALYPDLERDVARLALKPNFKNQCQLTLA